MKILAIAEANVRRMLADRSNIFFVFIFPLALVFLIGSQFGGTVTPHFGVVGAGGGPLAGELAASLEADHGLEMVEHASEQSLIEAIERAGIQAGMIIADSYDDDLQAGIASEVGFVARPDGVGPQLRTAVDAVVAEQGEAVTAARVVAEASGLPFGQVFEAARALAPAVPGVEVVTETVGDALFPASLGVFDLGASSQLVLFVFLNTLAGSAALIQSRQLGVSHRMLSTPTSVRTIVIGEATGRLGVALVQGIYIMVATMLIFGVDWGDPLGAIVLLVFFSLTGAGAALLMGSTFRNDQQAGGLGVVLGLGLAALGGAMLPIELFPPTMVRIAHLTPHAWALDGFAELVRRDGTVVDILPELAALAAFAVVLLALAGWRLRAVLTGGSGGRAAERLDFPSS